MEGVETEEEFKLITDYTAVDGNPGVSLEPAGVKQRSFRAVQREKAFGGMNP